MSLWQEYKRPASIDEAVNDLISAPGPALPIAGGTDLLLDLRQNHHSPVHTLVDLTCIPGMTGVEMRGNEIFIGAATAVNRLANDSLVIRHARALVEACNLIAGPQVRNTATLGGNVAHALPAADGSIALTALNAQAEVAGAGGRRRMPFTALFLGPGKSALDTSREIIVGFFLESVGVGQASCFKRIMRPQGVALPILNCAVWMERKKEAIKNIRIAVGPGGAIPFRATEAENTLREQPLNAQTRESALAALLNQAHFRTSARRASSDYRRHIIRGLFIDTLEEAWRRAGMTGAPG
jgi:carbon-monoxide dehydrogenase medium subunit